MAKYVTLNDKETQEELYPRTSTEAIVDIAEKFYSKEEVDSLHSDFVDSETVDSKVATAVSNLVGKAPSTLDTLEEMATALQEKGAVVDALDAAITNKADKSVVEEIKNNETEIRFSTESVAGAETLKSITVGSQSFNIPEGGSGSGSTEIPDEYKPENNVLRLHHGGYGDFNVNILENQEQEFEGSSLVDMVLEMMDSGRQAILDFGVFLIPVASTYDGSQYASMVGKTIKSFSIVCVHDYPTGSIDGLMFARFSWDSSTNKTTIKCVLPTA